MISMDEADENFQKFDQNPIRQYFYNFRVEQSSGHNIMFQFILA